MNTPIVLTILAVVLLPAMCAAATVERWGRHEVSLTAAGSYGNPFKEVRLKARFACGKRVVKVDGFCDGGRTWRVRLMP